MVNDWLSPNVGLCQPQTRGIWMDWLCQMHLLDRCGVIAGTREELAILGRCSTVHVEAALADLTKTKTADVTERNGIVTVVNRRMRREYNARNGSKIRMQRMRSDAACYASVAPHKSKSESKSERAEPSAHAGDAEIPTWDEVKTEAAMRGFPEASARKFYDHHEGNSLWLNQHQRLINWRTKLAVWVTNDRSTPASADKNAKFIGPKLSEVQAVAKEKWGDDQRHSNWSASFFRHWNDPKRNWQRDGKAIDWRVEFAGQVSKWRTTQ